MGYDAEIVGPRMNPDLTPELERETAFFRKWGYLVVEDALNVQQVETLRGALDETFVRRGETFTHQLLEEDDRFAFLLDHPPVLDRMKAILGNCVQLHSATARVTKPGEPDQNWHRDIPWPKDPEPPPYGNEPGQINCGYYLDQLTMENGPIVIVPGSHRAPFKPPETHARFPDEKHVLARPGQAVMFDGWLFHRGAANQFGTEPQSLPDVLPERLDEVPGTLRRPPGDGHAGERNEGTETAARRNRPVVAHMDECLP